LSIDYIKEGKIALFTINNPGKKNALDLASLKEFQRALVDFENEDSLCAGIITGAGEEAFCSGIDIKSTLTKDPENSPFPPTLMKGLEITKPLIAAVNGLALGGGFEVVLACDIRIASENAIFGFPEVKLGFIPDWGGTQRLTREISRCQASELLLTGKPIGVEEAYRMGIVNRIASRGKLGESARELAEDICQAGPLAVRAAREAMLKGATLSLEEGLNLETALAAYLKTTEDFEEGMRAFKEKRPPRFKGK
jgi:enoyl-CoA hydratase/carnithine racemase